MRFNWFLSLTSKLLILLHDSADFSVFIDFEHRSCEIIEQWVILRYREANRNLMDISTNYFHLTAFSTVHVFHESIL